MNKEITLKKKKIPENLVSEEVFKKAVGDTKEAFRIASEANRTINKLNKKLLWILKQMYYIEADMAAEKTINHPKKPTIVLNGALGSSSSKAINKKIKIDRENAIIAKLHAFTSDIKKKKGK